MQTSYIIFYVVLVAVAGALLLLWYLRQREMGAAQFPLTKSDFKSIVGHALHDLNIKVTWKKEGDNQVAHFTYQGGHFNIMLEKNSPFARLSYLFFYQADIDDIETVRMVCNLCNLNTDACRIVYTVDEKKSKVDVHLISVLPVHGKDMKDMLERVMGDSFRWQTTYASKFDEQKKQITPGSEKDKEKGDAMYERDLELIREQEMTHQEAGPDWHEAASGLMKLRGLLATAMGLTDIIPIRLTLAVDDKLATIDDPDAILDYPVSKPLIDGGAFVHNSATGRLDFYDPRDPVSGRRLTMDFAQEGSTADTLFYRITLALVPLSLGRKVSESDEQHSKRMTSVLLGYDLTPSEGRQAHFRYVWKEAMAKQKAGDSDKMTDEEKVLAGMQDQRLAYNYYHGRDLYLHKRFYEALLPLTDAFRTMTRKFDHHNRHVMDMIEEVAYFIGCCYMGLHQYERANYYLQLLLPTTHQSYSEAYVNCMVNSGDFRAMDMLTGLQGSLQTMLNNMDMQADDEDEEASQGPSEEQLTSFINFIKRRRAYMLVDNGKYGEAEKLLKQLLDDPDNSDFALSELAYIQKKK